MRFYHTLFLELTFVRHIFSPHIVPYLVSSAEDHSFTIRTVDEATASEVRAQSGRQSGSLSSIL